MSVWLFDGIRTEAAFEQAKTISEGNRRCLACMMDYEPYFVVILLIIAAMNTLFGAAAIVGLLRAFGPPVLTVTADREWGLLVPGSPPAI